MTPAQCKEARRLLNWTQRQVAEAAGTAKSIVGQFERIGVVPKARSGRDWRDAIRAALEAGGVVFVDRNGGGPGVRLRRAEP